MLLRKYLCLLFNYFAFIIHKSTVCLREDSQFSIYTVMIIYNLAQHLGYWLQSALTTAWSKRNRLGSNWISAINRQDPWTNSRWSGFLIEHITVSEPLKSVISGLHCISCTLKIFGSNFENKYPILLSMLYAIGNNLLSI